MRGTMLLTVLAILVGGSQIALAQQQRVGRTSSADEFITVRKSDVAPEILSKIEEKAQHQAFDEKVKQYGQWVGIGKEIGVAVNDGLEAVTDNASKFAETTPGKITIGVIVWKLVGRQALGLIVGVPLLIWLTYIFTGAGRCFIVAATFLVATMRPERNSIRS